MSKYNLKVVESELSVESHRRQVYQRIKEKLNSGAEAYRTRWFWELLQNAKDAVNENQHVEVYVNFKDGEIEFAHTGNPFLINEVVQLIVQGSSKSVDSNKTGRFGTGFITTYALSEQVHISGWLHEIESFDFMLDRKANDEDEFMRKQDESRDRLEQSIVESRPKGKISTRFKYPCLEDTYQVAKEGMREIIDLLPMTLAFNQKIRAVSVDIEGTQNEYRLDEAYPIGENGINHHSITQDNSNQVEIYTQDLESICIAAFNPNTKPQVKHLPRLFLSFPLQQSTHLGINLFFNSEEFVVKTEREHVIISDSDTKDVAKNKSLLEKAFQEMPQFLKGLSNQNIPNLHRLSWVDAKNLNQWDDTWYNPLKLGLARNLLSLPLIKLESSTQGVCINDLVIPDHDSEGSRKKIHTLLADIFPDKVPTETLSEEIYDVLNEYRKLDREDTLEIGCLWNLDRLAEHVATFEDLDSFSSSLNEPSKKFDWLNDFYALLHREGQSLLGIYRIVLAKDEKFIYGVNDIKINKVGDEELLEISEQLDLNWSPKLIHESITTLNQAYPALDKKSLMDQMLSTINSTANTKYTESEDAREANARLLRSLIDESKFDLIRSYQFLSLNKDGDLQFNIFCSN